MLSIPEEALEYNEDGKATVNLQDRVIIIRDGGSEPKQISLDSKIEQAQIHKQNIEDNLYMSLAVNKTSFGLTDVSQLSGEALRRMMTPTIARVEDKRNSIVKVFNELLDIEVIFSDVVPSSASEVMEYTVNGVNAQIISTERAVMSIGGDDEEIDRVKEEYAQAEYEPFDTEDKIDG